MTLRRSPRRTAAALVGLAVLSQVSSGCCAQRPLFSRLRYCGPVFNRPLLAGPVVGAPVGVPVEVGAPVGVPVGLHGAPGCASCGGGPVAAAPVAYPAGYPHDGFAHAPGLPPGHVVAGGVPPQFTGYPVIGQPTQLGGPTISKELPPPTAMPKQ